MCNLYQNYHDSGVGMNRSCSTLCSSYHKPWDEICEHDCHDYLLCFTTASNTILTTFSSPSSSGVTSDVLIPVILLVVTLLAVIFALIIFLCRKKLKRCLRCDKDVTTPDAVYQYSSPYDSIHDPQPSGSIYHVDPSADVPRRGSDLSLGTILQHELTSLQHPIMASTSLQSLPEHRRHAIDTSTDTYRNRQGSDADNSGQDSRTEPGPVVEAEEVMLDNYLDEHHHIGHLSHPSLHNDVTDGTSVSVSLSSSESSGFSLSDDDDDDVVAPLQYWRSMPTSLLSRLRQVGDFYQHRLQSVGDFGMHVLEIEMIGTSVSEARKKINEVTGLEDHQYNLTLMNKPNAPRFG